MNIAMTLKYVSHNETKYSNNKTPDLVFNLDEFLWNV